MTDDELKRLFESMRQEHVETRRHFDTVAERVEARAGESVNEMRRHFETVAERLEKRFDGLAESVDLLNEKLDRETAAIRDEMRRGFADTQARVERIESSTH